MQNCGIGVLFCSDKWCSRMDIASSVARSMYQANWSKSNCAQSADCVV